MTWILILFAHVGPMGSGNSNALATQVFSSQSTCIQAGESARKLVTGSVKSIEYVCVKQ